MTNKSITIKASEAKTRIDRIIAARFPDHSRNYFEQLFKMGKITIKNHPIKKNITCKEGDIIDIEHTPLQEVNLIPEDIPLEILFEDEHLIICNKPPGMVTHPARGSYTNTFAGALLYYLKTLPQSDDPLRPGIVHRLDKDTSGVIIAAKTPKTLTLLQKMFAERKIQKTYLAICYGRLKNQSINAPIGRHPVKRKHMTVTESGKDSLTHFKIINFNKGYSLVEAMPHTGRTHQIRVHAKHLKCPVVGDTLYGQKNDSSQRHLLHAYKLELIHPITDEHIIAKAPLALDMKEFCDLHQIQL